MTPVPLWPILLLLSLYVVHKAVDVPLFALSTPAVTDTFFDDATLIVTPDYRVYTLQAAAPLQDGPLRIHANLLNPFAEPATLTKIVLTHDNLVVDTAAPAALVDTAYAYTSPNLVLPPPSATPHHLNLTATFLLHDHTHDVVYVYAYYRTHSCDTPCEAGLTCEAGVCAP